MELGVEGNQELKEVRIVPRRKDYEGSFGEYGRPKMVRITLSGGTNTVVTLRDEPSLQKFPVVGKAERVRLDILHIYPGFQTHEILK